MIFYTFELIVNISLVYNQFGQHSQARGFYQQALNTFQAIEPLRQAQLTLIKLLQVAMVVLITGHRLY